MMGLRGLLLLLLGLVGVSARPQGDVDSGTGETTLAVETVTEALDTTPGTKPSALEALGADPTIASKTVTPGTTIEDSESETSFSGTTIEDSENATPSSGTTKEDNESATPASETTTEIATPSSGTTMEDSESATPASGTTTGDSENSTESVTPSSVVTIKENENATPASETTRAPTVPITVTEDSVTTEENDLPAEETVTSAVDNVTPADATTTVEALEEATTDTLPATETTPAPVVDVVVTESSETTPAPKISAEDLENILSLVAEEIVAEEIVAEEIVAEEIVAEELVAEEIKDITEAILTEEVIEGAAETIAEDIEEAVAVAKDRTPKAKTEDIENILAIIDELPATSPDVTKENVIRDIVRPVVVEEVKQIKLRITIQPGDSAVFMKGTVLGMSCDAYSEIDNEVEFSWTKNGRFIDTTTGHVFYESQKNGNIIIYSAGPEDEGLYQCVASNSEGVVFSKVSKVRQRKSQSRSRGRESSSRSLAGPPSPSLSGVWVVQPQPEFLEAVSDEKLMVVMSESVPSV